MWTHSETVSGEAYPKSSKSFIFDWFSKTIDNPFIRKFSVWSSFHLHEFRLHVIGRKWQEGAHDSWNTRCINSRAGRVLCSLESLNPFFDFVIADQHSNVHSYCSHNSRQRSSPKSHNSFFLDNPGKRISNMFVVSSLIHRQQGIRLESH